LSNRKLFCFNEYNVAIVQTFHFRRLKNGKLVILDVAFSKSQKQMQGSSVGLGPRSIDHTNFAPCTIAHVTYMLFV